MDSFGMTNCMDSLKRVVYITVLIPEQINIAV